jgi:hypothetical protein
MLLANGAKAFGRRTKFESRHLRRRVTCQLMAMVDKYDRYRPESLQCPFNAKGQ